MNTLHCVNINKWMLFISREKCLFGLFNTICSPIYFPTLFLKAFQSHMSISCFMIDPCLWGPTGASESWSKESIYSVHRQRAGIPSFFVNSLMRGLKSSNSWDHQQCLQTLQSFHAQATEFYFWIAFNSKRKFSAQGLMSCPWVSHIRFPESVSDRNVS